MGKQGLCERVMDCGHSKLNPLPNYMLKCENCGIEFGIADDEN